jgi:hypothetical protein
MSDQIIAYVSEYYSNKVETFGATPQGVDWNGSESQDLRFEQLMKVCHGAPALYSLNDYGCGYGALLDYLQDQRQSIIYQGYDCAQAMIDEARRLHGETDKQRFYAGGAFNLVADYTVASGIFNVRGELSDRQWLDYCLETMGKMNDISTRGMSFNMLTKYSDADKMRDYLHYADPCFIFDYCKRNFSRNVALLHDYGLYEFTMLVKKQ